MSDLMIKLDNVTKQYRLGQIGGTTLRDELQRKKAKLLGKDDPTKRIDAKDYVYGETFLALNNISFEISKGERVGIIGHNGAGKSTLLKLLSRVTAPTSGMIGLNGRVASMLEVGTGFHGELTGRENVYMNGAILGMTKKEIDDKIEDIIDFSECRQFIDTPVKRYSSGMYVKLAFSVAAHLNSEIMIMDEVLAVGDMAFQKKCLDKMREVSSSENRTILYVSHNMATIRTLCDRCLVLEHGELVFDGDVEKGIGVYLNSKLSGDYLIDYTNYQRAKWVENDRIRIERFEQICDHKQPPFLIERRDKFVVSVDFHSAELIDGTACRFEVRDELDAPLASSNMFNLLIKEGNNNIQIEYDLSSLATGRYRGVFVMFSIGSKGDYIIEDWVDGIPFQIIDTYQTDIIKWNRKSFGSIMLPEGVLC